MRRKMVAGFTVQIAMYDGIRMSHSFSLHPDAQARMDMLAASLSSSRLRRAKADSRELPLSQARHTGSDNCGAGENRHRLATDAALEAAEMILADLRHAEDR